MQQLHDRRYSFDHNFDPSPYQPGYMGPQGFSAFGNYSQGGWIAQGGAFLESHALLGGWSFVRSCQGIAREGRQVLPDGHLGGVDSEYASRLGVSWASAQLLGGVDLAVQTGSIRDVQKFKGGEAGWVALAVDSLRLREHCASM